MNSNASDLSKSIKLRNIYLLIISKKFIHGVTSLTKYKILSGLRQLVTADTPWCNRTRSENWGRPPSAGDS